MAELQRIASHLIWFGTFALDLGATTAFLYAWRERERLLDIFRSLTGARMLYNYLRIGGVRNDVFDGFETTVEQLPGRPREAARRVPRPASPATASSNRGPRASASSRPRTPSPTAPAAGPAGVAASRTTCARAIRTCVYDRYDFERARRQERRLLRPLHRAHARD